MDMPVLADGYLLSLFGAVAGVEFPQADNQNERDHEIYDEQGDG
jgi:hypothetical protein